MMFEHRKRDKLAPKTVFYARMRTGLGMASLMLAFSLGIGIIGYHHFCKLGWVDSLLNASMILTGMGPVDPMPDRAAKLFASAYAIFSGVAFLTTIAVVLAPVMHRAMHIFHIDDAERQGDN
jgi:hypothetical protein